MNTAIIPFDQQLPAHIKAMADVSADDLTSGVGAGFPIISIKGKVFHIQRGDELKLIEKPGGEEGEPAASIEVVILRANPNLSKVFYAEGYVEGSTEKPTCYSNDGIAPGMDAQERQSLKCATCQHNQWGSRISDAGKKGKACSDVRRMAVAPVGQVNDPMLIRVPAASLKPLMQYGDLLKKRGVKYPLVSTKIGFDYTVAHPALTFKPVGFLPEEVAKQVGEMLKSDVVAQIIGLAPGTMQDTTPAALPAPASTTSEPAPVKAPAPAAIAPKAAVTPKPPAAKKAAASPFGSGTPETTEPVAPKPTTKAARTSTQTSKVVEVADTSNLEAELDAVLKDAGFDDQPAEEATA